MERPIPVLSVIMPSYNVSDYIDFAIRNVVEHQFGVCPHDQWELIIIDDGSTDSTLAIAEQWQQRYPKSIRVIHTHNQGVSKARNLGLSLARGTYVYFMDSDDVLLQNSLIPLCTEAVNRGIDVVKFIFREIDTPTYSILQHNTPFANLSSDDFYECSAIEFVIRTNGLSGPPLHHNTWSSLYSRQFLYEHCIRFIPTLSIGEDLILTWQTMLANPRVLYSDRALYLYHQRSDSAMHVTDSSKYAKNGKAYANFLIELLGVERNLAKRGMNVPQAHQGLAINFKFGYNRALCYMILGGDSLWRIYRNMRHIKVLGGDIHPGRPRFDKTNRRRISICNKLRRWLVAYILAPFA